MLIDEELNFLDCLERRALKRSAIEEVYKELLQLFQKETNKEEFLQRNAKNFGKGKYEPLQVDTKNFKQNIMLSNNSGAKSETEHEKTAAWLQRVIQSCTKN